jgi:hypothetical protein
VNVQNAEPSLRAKANAIWEVIVPF